MGRSLRRPWRTTRSDRGHCVAAGARAAGWWAPLLKVGLIAAYVPLAPWVGPLADAHAKGRVMTVMNLVKLTGLLAMLAGLHPVLAMVLVGLGAAALRACQIRLVTELVRRRCWCGPMPGSRSPWWARRCWARGLGGLLVSAAWLGLVGGLQGSLAALLAVYLLSSGLNAFIPDTGYRRVPDFGQAQCFCLCSCRQFWAANLRLHGATPRGGPRWPPRPSSGAWAPRCSLRCCAGRRSVWRCL